MGSLTDTSGFRHTVPVLHMTFNQTALPLTQPHCSQQSTQQRSPLLVSRQATFPQIPLELSLLNIKAWKGTITMRAPKRSWGVAPGCLLWMPPGNLLPILGSSWVPPAFPGCLLPFLEASWTPPAYLGWFLGASCVTWVLLVCL